MDTIRAFFPQNQGTFFDFQKRARKPPPLLSPSCPPESIAEQLYLVSSLEMDKKMREAAAELLDERLITKLDEGELVTTESKYQKT